MRRGSDAGALVVEGLGKRFSRRGPWALSGIDLRLSPGSVSVVVGGNGSGKTSLLRVLAGLSRPTEGVVQGRPRVVGFVPERLPTGLRMTAAQYVEHMSRIRGLKQPEVRERSGELFGRLALAPGPHVDLSLLSKGNRQKVALVQALICPMGLLALDEPYGGLDHDSHRALALILASAARSGATVLITAHDQSEVRDADLVVELDDGHLVSVPAPRKVDARIRVELQGPAVAVGEAELAALDGAQIIDHNEVTGELCLLMDQINVDASLKRMLAAGFSVLYVGPSALSRDAHGS